MSEPTLSDSDPRTHEHLHIGAGSLGLGMIVEVCRKAGFETAVLNRHSSKEHHELLGRLGNYHVIFDGNPKTRITLRPQFHYYKNDDDSLALDLLASPSVKLITTAVKKDNLSKIAPLLFYALNKRMLGGSSGPLCILACENHPNNSVELRKHIEQLTKREDRKRLLRGVYFCNTLVDRVCATISCRNDEVEVHTESFHSWVVTDHGTGVPVLDLLSKRGLIRLVSELEFNGHEVQKYWCMNGVHLAAAAYAYNYDPNLMHFHNALAVHAIREKVEVLQQELILAFLLYVSRKGLQDYFPFRKAIQFNKNVLRRLDKNRTDTIARVLKQQGP